MDNPEDRFELCGKRRAILDGSGHMLVVGGPGPERRRSPS